MEKIDDVSKFMIHKTILVFTHGYLFLTDSTTNATFWCQQANMHGKNHLAEEKDSRHT